MEQAVEVKSHSAGDPGLNLQNHDNCSAQFREYCRMKKFRISLLAAACLAAFADTLAAAEPLSGPLEKGLLAEEVHQNLDAAIQEYQSVLTQFTEQRKIAATALFRLGECYRKLGNSSQAAVQFERLIREFPDQTNLVQLSRKFFTEAGRTAVAAGASSPSQPSEAEARLIREEIALVEQLLKDAERRRESGRASAADVIEIKRQLLPLLRKLPENTTPDKQKALIREEIALVEDLLGQVQKATEVGAASVTDQIPLRRDLLVLQRELLAADQAPRFQSRLNTIVRRAEPSEAASPEESKEIERLQRIIQNSPDLINGRRMGVTPLQQAAAAGQLSVARFLLEHNADIDAVAQEPSAPAGRTALHLAADAGHKAMVELLLKGGANVNARDRIGRTPLFDAVDRGYLAVAQVLLANGADANAASNMKTTPLHQAVSSGSKALIDLLLANQADLNAQPGQDSTPLMAAVTLARKQDIVRLLLEKGADVQRKTKQGSTALTLSIQQGSAEITELLLAHGADPNVIAITSGAGPQQLKFGPIHSAAAQGDVASIKTLLKHGADANLLDRLQRTALHWAVEGGHADAVHELIRAGANVDVQDSTGDTALMRALAKGRTDLASQLIEKGADVNLANLSNDFPLLLCIKNRYNALIDPLLSKGADLSQKGPYGYTPLHVACGQLGGLDLVQRLIRHQAQVNARDNAGNTPLHYAAVSGAAEVIQLLLESGADPEAANAAKETPLAMLQGDLKFGRPPKNYAWNDWGLPVESGGVASPGQLSTSREAAALLRKAAQPQATEQKKETPKF